jgi:spermidine synthase
VVGLGAGTIAAYGRPGEQLTLIELNPAVVDIARDPRLFTYLRDSRADVHVVVGDGRLELQSEPAHSYDLIVLDAFSSDAIPVHLLTREAVQMYADRLRPGGLLVFHITNATFDLRPVLEADASALHWVAAVGTRRGDPDGGRLSTWAVLTAHHSDLGAIASQPGWTPLPRRSVAWTDDYSSVLSVLK